MDMDRSLGAIHKPRGQFLWVYLAPSSSWTLLLNEGYVVKWSFH